MVSPGQEIIRSKLQPIFMIVFEINARKGGMTTAMLNRSRVFESQGHQVHLVTFDFNPDYDAELAALIGSGRLSPGVHLTNIHKYYSSINTLDRSVCRSPGTPPADIGPSDTSGEVRIRREYHSAGYMVREVTIDVVSGVPCAERYFTPDGFCYLTTSLNIEKGVPRALSLNFRDGSPSQSFTNNRHWRIDWLNRLARQEVCRPVFICDGPGSAPTVMGMERGLAYRLYQIHINHFLEPFEFGSPIDGDHRLIFSKIEGLDQVVVLTDQQRKDIVADFGGAHKISVIPNFCDVGTVPSVDKKSHEVCMLVRFHPQKRVDDAIRAFVRVRSRVPTAVLRIYGMGEERENYVSLISELRLDECVVLEKYTTDTRRVLAASACSLMTSSYEAFSLSIAESLSAGTPVVALDCPYGPSSLIDDGRNGFLIKNRDLSVFADAIVLLLNDPAKAAAMGREGRRMMVENYSDDDIYGQWIGLIGSITGPAS